jgi:hypothetical protein
MDAVIMAGIFAVLALMFLFIFIYCVNKINKLKKDAA